MSTDARYLVAALNRAMHEVLGPNVETVIPPVEGAKRRAWATIPDGEATIVWLRNHIRGKAEEIISRAQQLYRPAKTDSAYSFPFDRQHDAQRSAVTSAGFERHLIWQLSHQK